MATIKVSSNMLNPYETAKAVYSGSPLYSALGGDETWTLYGRSNNLDTLIGVLSEQDKLNGVSTFMDSISGFEYLDNNMKVSAAANELWGDKETLNTYERYLTDEAGNFLTDDDGNYLTEEYETTEYEYYKDVLEQYAATNKYYADIAEEQQRKDDMNGFVRFLADLASAGMHVLNAAAENVYSVAKLVTSPLAAYYMDEASWSAFDEAWREWMGAEWFTNGVLNEFDRKYTDYMDVTGNTNGVGSMVISIADSIGQALPSMLTGMTASKLGVSGSVFYKVNGATYWIGMGVNTLTDYINNSDLNDVPTFALVALAAGTTTIEALITKFMTKTFGGTVIDKYIFGAQTIGQQALKDSILVTGKNAVGQVLLRVAKAAAKEGYEEVLQEFSTAFINGIAALFDDGFEQYSEFTAKTWLTAFALGALSTTITEGLSIITTKRDVTGEVKKVTKKGKTVYKKFNLATTLNLQDLMQKLMTTFTDIEKSKTLDQNTRTTQLAELTQMMRMLGEFYNVVDSKIYKDALQILSRMSTLPINDNGMIEYKLSAVKVKDTIPKLVQRYYINASREQLLLGLINDPNTLEVISKHNPDADIPKLDVDKIKSEATDQPENKRGDAAENKTEVDTSADVSTETEATETPKESEVTDGDRKTAEEVMDITGAENVVIVDAPGDVAEQVGDIIIVNPSILKKDATQIVKSMALSNLRNTLSVRIGNTLTELGNLYKKVLKIKGKVSNSTVVAALLVNHNGFLDIALQYANSDTLRVITTIYSLLRDVSKLRESKLTESEKAIYQKTMEDVFKIFTEALTRYYSVQYNANPNDVDFLTDDQRERIRKSRLTQDIVDRFIENKSTEREIAVIRNLVNNMAINDDTKQELLKVLDDPSAASSTIRRNVIMQLINNYNERFSNKYDNITYLEQTSVQNSVFNNWLMSQGLVITNVNGDPDFTSVVGLMDNAANNVLNDDWKNILYQFYTVNQADVDKQLKADADKTDTTYEGITKENIQNYAYELMIWYFKNNFNLYTGGLYTFDIVDGTSHELGGVSRTISTVEVTSNVIHDNGVFKSTVYNFFYNQNEDSRYMTSLVTDANSYISQFVADNINDASKKFLTVHDLISNPELLNGKTRNEIITDYGQVNSRTVLAYLQNYLTRNYNNIQIVQMNDGRYVLAKAEYAKNMFKKDVKKPRKGTLYVSQYIDDSFLYGNLKETKIKFIKIDNVNKVAEYDSSSNTIYISDKYRNEAYDFNNANRFKFILLHEFEHAVQYYNDIASGSSSTFYNAINKSTKAEQHAIVNFCNDVMMHNASYFDNRTSVSNNNDIADVFNFVYKLTAGELYANAVDIDYIKIQPFVINYNSNIGTLTIVTAWGNTYKFNTTNYIYSHISLEEVDNVIDTDITGEEAVSKPKYHRNTKNNKQHITLPNGRVWAPTGRYVTSKNARGTNLEYYTNGVNKRVQLDEDLQRFIVSANLAELSPYLADLIRKGKLSKSHGVMSVYYFIRHPEGMNEYTFKLIRDNFFPNSKVASWAKLTEYVDNATYNYAVLVLFHTQQFENNSNFKYQQVDLSGKGISLEKYYTAAENNGAQELLIKYGEYYTETDSKYGIDKGALRMRLLKYFDGSAESVYSQYNMVKWLAENEFETTDSKKKNVQEFINKIKRAYNSDNNPEDILIRKEDMLEMIEIRYRYWLEQHPDEAKDMSKPELDAKYNEIHEETMTALNDYIVTQAFINEMIMLGCVDESYYIDAIDQKVSIVDKTKLNKKRESIRHHVNAALNKASTDTIKSIRAKHPEFKISTVQHNDGTFSYVVDGTIFQGADYDKLNVWSELADTIVEEIEDTLTGRTGLKREVSRLTTENNARDAEIRRLQDKLNDMKDKGSTLQFTVDNKKTTYTVTVSGTEVMSDSVKKLFDRTFNNENFYKKKVLAKTNLTAAGDEFTKDIDDVDSVVVTFNDIYDEIIIELNEFSKTEIDEIIDYFTHTGVMLDPNNVDGVKRYIAIEAAILVNFLERARYGTLTLTNEQVKAIENALAAIPRVGGAMLPIFRQAGAKINMFDKLVKKWSQNAEIELSEDQLNKLGAAFAIPTGEQTNAQHLASLVGEEVALPTVSEEQARKAKYQEAIAEIYKTFTTQEEVNAEFQKKIDRVRTMSDNELRKAINDITKDMTPEQKRKYTSDRNRLIYALVAGEYANNKTAYEFYSKLYNAVNEFVSAKGYSGIAEDGYTPAQFKKAFDKIYNLINTEIGKLTENVKNRQTRLADLDRALTANPDNKSLRQYRNQYKQDTDAVLSRIQEYNDIISKLDSDNIETMVNAEQIIKQHLDRMERLYIASTNNIINSYTEYTLNNITEDFVMQYLLLNDFTSNDVKNYEDERFDAELAGIDAYDTLVKVLPEYTGEQFIGVLYEITDDYRNPDMYDPKSPTRYGMIAPSIFVRNLLGNARNTAEAKEANLTGKGNKLFNAIMFAGLQYYKYLLSSSKNKKKFYSPVDGKYISYATWNTDWSDSTKARFGAWLSTYDPNNVAANQLQKQVITYMSKKLAQTVLATYAKDFESSYNAIEDTSFNKFIADIRESVSIDINNKIQLGDLSIRDMIRTLGNKDPNISRYAQEQMYEQMLRDTRGDTYIEHTDHGDVTYDKSTKKQIISAEDFEKQKQDAYNDAYKSDIDLSYADVNVTEEQKAQMIAAIIKDIELDILSQNDSMRSQKTYRSKWERLIDFEKMMMLSSPSTWMRNAVTNTEVYLLNKMTGAMGKGITGMFKGSNAYKRNQEMTFTYSREQALQAIQIAEDNLKKAEEEFKKGTGSQTAVDVAKQALKEAKNRLSKGKVYTIAMTQVDATTKSRLHVLFDDKNGTFYYNDVYNKLYAKERQYKILEREIAQLEAQYDSIARSKPEDVNQKIATATAEIETLKKQIAELQAKIDAYNKLPVTSIERSDGAADNTRNKAQLQALKRKLEVNEYTLSENKKAQQYAVDHSEEIKKIDEQLAQISKELDEKRSQFKTLGDDIKNLRAQYNPDTATRKNVSFYTLVADGLSRYESNTYDAKKQQERSEQYKKLQEKLDKATKAFNEAERAYKAYQSDNTLKERRDVAYVQYIIAKRKYDQAKADYAIVNDEYTRLYNAQAKAIANVNALLTKINEQNKLLTELQQSYEERIKYRDDNKKTWQTLPDKERAIYIDNNRKLESIVKRIKSTKEYLNRLQERYDDAILKRDEAVNNYTEYKPYVAEVKNRLKQLTEPYNKAKQVYETANKQYENNEKLKTEYEGTKRQLEQVQSKISAFNAKGTSTSDIVELIVNNMMSKLYSSTKFKSDKLNTLSKWLYKMLSDDPWIKRRTEELLGKMVVETGVDTSNLYSQDMMQLFAEAYNYAAWEFMHRSNFWNTLEQKIHQETKSGYFLYKQFLPFISASWNWFLEGLNYTPVGLIKGIRQFAKLEKSIDNMNTKTEQGTLGKFALYESYKNIGKGILGTVGTIIGLLLGGFGVAVIDDEDDEVKIKFGDDTYWDISDIFGSTGIFTGMVLATVIRDAATSEDGFGVNDVFKALSQLGDAYMRDNSLYNMYNSVSYTDSLGEYLLETIVSVPTKFIPNAWKFIISIVNSGSAPKYSSGFLGTLQYYYLTSIFTSYMLPDKYNVYTGEVDYKYGSAGATTGMNIFNKLASTLFGSWDTYNYSDLELMAKSLGLNKSQLSGSYEDIGELTLEQKSLLNEMYGKLNKQYLTEFVNNKTKYSVEQDDGTYVTLSYSQMTNEQRKNVFNRIMSKDASYAKIYVYTKYMGGKYYADTDTYQLLRSLGITKNVYRETGKYSGFN